MLKPGQSRGNVRKISKENPQHSEFSRFCGTDRAGSLHQGCGQLFHLVRFQDVSLDDVHIVSQEVSYRLKFYSMVIFQV